MKIIPEWRNGTQVFLELRCFEFLKLFDDNIKEHVERTKVFCYNIICNFLLKLRYKGHQYGNKL